MGAVRQLLGRARRAVWPGRIVRPTTALANYLAQHPGVVAPSDKEVDYFGSAPRHARGEAFYHSHYRHLAPPGGAVSFDASPHYLLVPEAAGRIRDYDPGMRLICLLREPAARAWSAFTMYRRFLDADPGFFAKWNRRCYPEAVASTFLPRPPGHAEDMVLALREEIEALGRGEMYEWHLLPYGLYAKNLRPFLDAFPRDQLLVMGSRRLGGDTAGALAEIARFIGLDAFQWTKADLGKKHAESYRGSMPEEARGLLEEFYAGPNRELEELLGDELPY